MGSTDFACDPRRMHGFIGDSLAEAFREAAEWLHEHEPDIDVEAVWSDRHQVFVVYRPNAPSGEEAEQTCSPIPTEAGTIKRPTARHRARGRDNHATGAQRQG